MAGFTSQGALKHVGEPRNSLFDGLFRQCRKPQQKISVAILEVIRVADILVALP